MGKARKKNQDKKKKVNLVFDETKRKEFLCGFRKRKLERKKKAQEELQRLLKEEKKRIKQENKESYKKLVVSSRPIPDFDKLLEDEYEDDNVNVKIVELSTDALEQNDLVIGQNRPKLSAEVNPIKIKKIKKKEQNVPGMGSDVESEHQSESENENNDDQLKSKKEIKQMLKHQATKKIQKSKIFQMKSKLDRVQNRKKSKQKKAQIKGKGDQRKDKTKKKGKRKH